MPPYTQYEHCSLNSTHIETISTNHSDWWLYVYCNISRIRSQFHWEPGPIWMMLFLLIHKHLWVLGLLLPFQFQETTNLLCHINTNSKPKKNTNKSCSNRVYNRPMECSEWIDFRNGRLFFLVLFYFCIRWVDETHLNFNGQSVNGSKICFNWDSAYAFISLFVVLLFCSSYFITHDHFLFNQHRFGCIYYWLWKHMCCLLLLSSAIP